MRNGKNLLLALTLLCGLGSADMAMAQAGDGSAAAGGAAPAAAPASKPKRQPRIGKRLRKVASRFHKKKAPAASSGAGSTTTPQN